MLPGFAKISLIENLSKVFQPHWDPGGLGRPSSASLGGGKLTSFLVIV